MKRQRTLFETFDRESVEEGAGTSVSKCSKPDCADRETQHNTVSVNQPRGPTTVVINSCNPVSKLIEYSSLHEAAPTDKVPCDLALSPDDPPCQPIIKYPTTVVGGKQRSFNSEWYKSYSWLEYSVKSDAAFCYPCRLFTTGEGRSHNTFTEAGFRDWKHATGKGGILTIHDKCSTHVSAMQAWLQYKLNAERHTSIAQRMESNRAQIVSNNRHYLKAVIEVLLLCAHQEITLRGHRESSDAPNRGNFIEILNLVAAHDPIVHQRLQEGPRNAVYTSGDIQNTLLHVMGEMVREKICAEVKDAGVYSILADESKDSSKTEQMAIVVRYVDIKKAIIHERFLTFVKVSSLDAASLTEYYGHTQKSPFKFRLNCVAGL